MNPRVKLAHLPTPVEPLPRLSAALMGPRLLVKRDDQTGLALGGNKTRKLEYLLAEALANGAHMLITAGAIQSNHCRQTAAAAARLGLACTLVLSGEEPDQMTGNLLLDRILGARVVWCRHEERDTVLQYTFDVAWENGQRPYLIPYGGSNAVGATAYAQAMQEFLDQNEPADWIVFPTSSGGTQAGLVVGARRAHWPGKVLGISVDEPADVLQERVAHLAVEVADRVGLKMDVSAEEIIVNADYLGGGYAVMGAAEQEAISLFARQEGLLLDPVYTGRAAAGLIDLIRKGFFPKEDTVLFWHTGGIPALLARPYYEELSAME